jgi:hypothetical protein
LNCDRFRPRNVVLTKSQTIFYLCTNKSAAIFFPNLFLYYKESYNRSELTAIAQPDIITINGRSGGKICERNLDDTSFDREERTQMTYSELIQIVFATYDTLVWNFKQYDIDGLFATHVFEQSKPTRTSAVSALATVALNGDKRSTMALK